MFASPQEMISDYMRGYRVEYTKNERVLDAIEQYKADALQRISKIVDVFYVDTIAVTIASGYEQEVEQAIEIVNRLSLNDKHIAALLNDLKMMEEILTEEALEAEHYENLVYGEE